MLRYTGVIVLTYTFTAVMCVKEEFEQSVKTPLTMAVGGSLDDITSVRETMSVVFWRLANGDAADEMENGYEEDLELIDWAERVKQAAVFAVELDRKVVQENSPDPGARQTDDPPPVTKSYSPFDSFYGSTASESQPEIRNDRAEVSVRKSEAERNAEAIAAWNEAMRESARGLLTIPDGAALYPYQHAVQTFIWLGCGLLGFGTLPLLWQRMIGKR